jgi:CarD family transcriptional regulator
MFKIGEYAVCPGHSVGQIIDIEEKDLGGELKAFYILKIIANGMTVMVPTDTKDGIRKLVESEEVSEVYTLLKNHDVELDTSTWNRRYREYMNCIKTGSLLEIAQVLRELTLLKYQKTLSFGEKKMLEQCRGLIAEEISLANNIDIKDVSGEINSCFDS